MSTSYSLETCYKMYHLATMHSTTDGWRDRQTDASTMPTADHTSYSTNG